MNEVCHRLRNEVVDAGICTGCGACVALDSSRASEMADTERGPIPMFHERSDLPPLAWEVCPGKGFDYLRLYREHYGTLPENWLLGCWRKVRTGHAAAAQIRRRGASGGVISCTLIHLLETGRIDAAITVQQHPLEQERVRVRIARSREDILNSAGSIYVPVSTLDILRTLNRAERYAMTCLPDQAAALRLLQRADFAPARQIRYLLGPYTGTAMYPGAIRCFLRSRFVRRRDRVMSLRWRAGEWPGYLEIRTASGRVLRAKKFYYNYLIPFFVTQASLQSMDFTNEFCDLSVGDAWSPRFESKGGGYSVVTTRSNEMEEIISEMIRDGDLVLNEEYPLDALGMHGHMLDFKKRGSYIRNRIRRFFGRKAPEYGIRPRPLPYTRWAVECVIMAVFALGRTRPARFLVGLIPSWLIGPFFDIVRRVWKALSKPIKRKSLRHLTMDSA